MLIKEQIDEIAEYLSDASCFKGYCDYLYIPESEEDIINLIKEANKTHSKLTISAAGTGLTGSRVPLGGGLVSMENFNKILNLDVENKLLTVQPFVRLFEIDEYLNSSGLFYPPNPTEKLATIGGNIGNNASGSRTYLYGATRKYVQAMKIILPSGDKLFLNRGEVIADNYSFSFYTNEGNLFEFDIFDLPIPNVKHAAGYFVHKDMDLLDLFIGAEGTLGIVTEITLRLLDAPEEVIGALIFFDEHKGMHDYIDYLRIGEINPRLIEFFDVHSLNLLRPKINQIPEKAHYALWLEFETTSDDIDLLSEMFYSNLEKYTNLSEETWYAQNSAEHRRLAEFRHALPLAVYEEIQKYEQQKLGTDSAVPIELNREYHEYIISLFNRENLDFVIWGHIGNAHYHANIITKNEREFEIAKEVFRNILQKAIDLNGTVSAEHGIGKIKKEYFKMLFSDVFIGKMKHIKKALDPNLILNIGNIFDLDE